MTGRNGTVGVGGTEGKGGGKGLGKGGVALGTDAIEEMGVACWSE